MKKLEELKSDPKWISELTAEDQHRWYLKIKETLPVLKRLGPTDELEQAISEYEIRKGLV